MNNLSHIKRSKLTGKGKGPEFLQLMHWIVRTPEFAALKGGPLKMLIDLGCQYNGRNNGDLCPALLRKSGRWSSESRMHRALAKLSEGWWIIKTKSGGLGMGSDLYAITWWPIDECKGRHGYRAEHVASHLWKTEKRHPNQVLITPESGVVVAPNCSEIDQLTPESGARNANFKAA